MVMLFFCADSEGALYKRAERAERLCPFTCPDSPEKRGRMIENEDRKADTI